MSASDIDLIIGRRAPSGIKGQVEQFLVIRNAGQQVMNAIIECGFIKEPDVVADTGAVDFKNIKPGQTAYNFITAKVPFDRADCRIANSSPVAED